MTRQVRGLFVIAVTSLAGACQSDELDEQAELQALLHDEALRFSATGGTDHDAALTDRDAAILPAGLLGAWDFDDCNQSRTQLFDTTFNGNTAYRGVNVACTTGIQFGQGAQIAATEDIVYVPDQPNFTFENGVTVAGWFRPTTIGGTKTLFRKRDDDSSSFALMLNSGKFQFIVNLGNGTAISVTSPKKATAGVYQHVAGTYDGTTARLYVDGLEATTFAVPGAMPNGQGPLVMGNDGSERRYNGALDAMVFTTHALTADQVRGLTCFPQSPTMVVTPSSIPATSPGVPVAIDVALTNHSPAACGPITFELFDFDFGPGLTLDPPPFTSVQSVSVASGTTGHMTITATATEDANPGDTRFVQFDVFEPTTNFFSFGFVPFVIGEPAGCHVSTKRELMITDLSVVNDPVRTTGSGVWTFKHLMEEMAPTPADAPAMVEAMLTTFTVPQTINGFTVAERPGMQSFILSQWPRTPSGALDLAQAPFRLLAIVDRFDLRDLAAGDAGEGRFVFAFAPSSFFFPLQATLILEYKLPAASDADVRSWAQAFHGLGALAFGPDYNAALQVVTERFAGRNARPGTPNGSAINAVRTNEIDLGNNGLWELREFHLSPATGLLEPAPLALTPDRSFGNSSTLGSYINDNQAAILLERHVVPAQLGGQPFQAGAVFNDLTTWFAPGVDNEARHHFALNTCNGCHSLQETNVFFLQIEPRLSFQESPLSGFLRGTTVSDPVTGQLRTFNDLARRNADLKAIVCTSAPAPALRRGIARVH